MKREHEIKGELPTGYEALEYIQATGTQYIQTVYIITPNTRIVTDYKYNSLVKQTRVFCSHTMDYNYATFSLYINGSGQFAYAHQNGSGNWISTYKTPNTSRHIFDFNNQNNTLKIDNGSFYSTTMSGSVSKNAKYNMVFFADIDQTTGNVKPISEEQRAEANFYESVCYEGEDVSAYYVPVLRLADNKPGLYDLCESICPLTGTPFYVNAGTGEFLYN